MGGIPSATMRESSAHRAVAANRHRLDQAVRARGVQRLPRRGQLQRAVAVPVGVRRRADERHAVLRAQRGEQRVERPRVAPEEATDEVRRIRPRGAHRLPRDVGALYGFMPGQLADHQILYGDQGGQ